MDIRGFRYAATADRKLSRELYQSYTYDASTVI